MSGAAGSFPLAGVVRKDIEPAGMDLRGLEGRAVELDTGAVVVMGSTTDQATTNQRFGIGVLTRGTESGSRNLDIVEDFGDVPILIGTGGLDPGDMCVPEYSATPANRGRFIKVNPAATLAGTVIWGACKVGGAAGATGVLSLHRRRTVIPAGG